MGFQTFHMGNVDPSPPLRSILQQTPTPSAKWRCFSFFICQKSGGEGRVVTGRHRGRAASNQNEGDFNFMPISLGWKHQGRLPKNQLDPHETVDFLMIGWREKTFFQTFWGARVAEVVRCSWCLSPLRIQRVTTMSKQPFPGSSQAPAHRACLTWQTNDVWRRRIPKSHEDYDYDLPSPVSKGQIPQCATCTCDHMQPWKITTTPVLPSLNRKILSCQWSTSGHENKSGSRRFRWLQIPHLPTFLRPNFHAGFLQNLQAPLIKRRGTKKFLLERSVISSFRRPEEAFVTWPIGVIFIVGQHNETPEISKAQRGDMYNPAKLISFVSLWSKILASSPQNEDTLLKKILQQIPDEKQEIDIYSHTESILHGLRCQIPRGNTSNKQL